VRRGARELGDAQSHARESARTRSRSHVPLVRWPSSSSPRAARHRPPQYPRVQSGRRRGGRRRASELPPDALVAIEHGHDKPLEVAKHAIRSRTGACEHGATPCSRAWNARRAAKFRLPGSERGLAQASGEGCFSSVRSAPLHGPGHPHHASRSPRLANAVAAPTCADTTVHGPSAPSWQTKRISSAHSTGMATHLTHGRRGRAASGVMCPSAQEPVDAIATL
jgi:hypothetical protein